MTGLEFGEDLLVCRVELGLRCLADDPNNNVLEFGGEAELPTMDFPRYLSGLLMDEPA